jgi:CrcB protein
VNVAGSLAMGLLAGWLALKADGASQEARLFLATGVLGGFTTFSAFSLEVATMLRSGETLKAGLYAGVSVLLGVSALFIGLWMARRIFA